MDRLGQGRFGSWAARGLALAAVVAAPSVARGQDGPPLRTFDVPLDQPAVAVMMPEGGSLRVTGSVANGTDGTVLDAATATTPGGASTEGGLVDAAASGLVLAERDPASHTYTYRASGAPGPTCEALLMGQTCVALRTAQIAAAELRDLGELREELTGGLHVEIFAPQMAAVTPPVAFTPPSFDPGSYTPYEPPPPSVPIWIWAVGGASTSGLLVALIVLGVAVRRRKAATPLARVQAAAARLHRRLQDDPVRARLLGLVHDLAAEAESVARMESRLAAAVRDAKPEELERRRAQLAQQAEGLVAKGGEEAGKGELDGAVQILDDQIERCRRWEMQRWRCGARLERIATRLEALEVELNDPTTGREGGGDGLLDALQEEIDLARAGEQEAEKLLGPRPKAAA